MTVARWLLYLWVLCLCQGCATTPEALSGTDEYIITVALPETPPPVPYGGSVKVYLADDEWQIPLSVDRSIRELRDTYELAVVDTWPLRLIDEFCLVVRIDDQEKVDRIRRDPRVISIQEINHFATMKTSPSYNDDKLEAQFGDNVDALERLHQWSTGKDVRVGIIDTPIDERHPDLKARIRHQEVFIQGEPDAKDLVHGTAVAGIISAQAGNGIGIVGFAPDAELHSYAACHHRDDWQKTVCNTFSLAKALAAVANDDIQVLNMSLAGPEDFLLTRLIDALVRNGTIVVASDNPDGGALRFPASMEHVIAATRLDDSRQMSPPLIRADDEHLTTRSGGSYQFFYGSSMSAARVTALISLLLEHNPDINDFETRSVLANVADNCHTALDAEDSCAMKFALSDRRVVFSMNHDDD